MENAPGYSKMTTVTRRFVQAGDVPNKFNAVRFINTGTVTAMVNNFPLAPGASVGWGYPTGGYDQGSYTVDFPNGLTGAEVYAIMTFYMELGY